MLIQCSHWLGEDYIPCSGAGQVNPTQIRWAENEGGVAPQRKFWEQGTETGLAEMQLGLEPGTRLQPADRISQCAWAVA